MRNKKSNKLDLALPEHVYPLGVRFQVQLVDKFPDDEDLSGDTCSEHRRIRINQSQDTRRRWTTLLHEYMHAVFVVNGIHSVGDEDLEEVVVQSLEHAIECFLLTHGQQFLAALAVQTEDV